MMPAQFTVWGAPMAPPTDASLAVSPAPAAAHAHAPMTFTTTDRQTLSLAFALEEVVNLRQGAVAALRVEPTVRQVKTGQIVPTRTFGRLSDVDIAIIDRATVEFAARMMSRGPAKVGPPLILPASFRTVAGRRGRAELAFVTGGSSQLLKSRVILELVDIDRGTPAGRLTEVAGLVAAVCRAVFVRLQPGREAIGPVEGARVHGLTVDGADLGDADGDAAGLLLETGAQAKGLAPMLVAQGLTSDVYFAVAEVAGFTHAALRPA
jgi:hypothetical protein